MNLAVAAQWDLGEVRCLFEDTEVLGHGLRQVVASIPCGRTVLPHFRVQQVAHDTVRRYRVSRYDQTVWRAISEKFPLGWGAAHALPVAEQTFTNGEDSLAGYVLGHEQVDQGIRVAPRVGRAVQVVAMIN